MAFAHGEVAVLALAPIMTPRSRERTRMPQSHGSALSMLATSKTHTRPFSCHVWTGLLREDFLSSIEVCSAVLPGSLRRPADTVAGTYTRTSAIDTLIQSFLSSATGEAGPTPERQIISLGAGTDTRPFRLFAGNSHTKITYHEIDFDVTSRRKLQLVQGNPQLSRILTSSAAKGPQIWTARPFQGGEYYCHGMDLRTLDNSMTEALEGLRTDIPTLILSECCLCYLKIEEAERVLRYFTSRIANVATIIYEPVHLDDAFGNTMVSNLAARNIQMPGMDRYRNAKDQIQRLRDAGFGAAECKSVEAIWESWIDAAEKERVDQLEGLDEVEEWKLLAGHYIVVWGVKGEGLGTLLRSST